MRQVLKFLSQTIGDNSFIGDVNIYEVLNYVDASYGMRNYMRGHTDGFMTYGWRLIDEKSSKQKLNTKISTGSEVVGASDNIPFSIWLDMYTEHKSFKVKQNQPMHDNMSAMKMEKNGQNSCTGNSRHINTRYLFVKDRFDKKEIDIVHCPT